MSIALKVPEVGESISEVQIGEWLKREGDHVERNEEVVVIETDKATVEVSAPESGRVARIIKKTGESASVNEVIGYIEAEKSERAERSAVPEADHAGDEFKRAEAAVKAQPQSAKDVAKGVPPAEPRDKAPRTITLAKQRTREQPEPEERNIRRSETKPVIVGQALNDEELEDKQAVSLGQAVAERVEREEPENRAHTEPPATPPPAARGEPSTAATIALDVAGERGEKLQPMSQLRRVIAERLVQAQKNAALLTTFNEIEMSAVLALRRQHGGSFQEKNGVKLGFMSFFVKASVEALQLVPEVNAEIRGENIVYRNYCDIGIAVGGGRGLVVPVLRSAERLSFAEIERAIHDFARRAEDNKLKPGELQGGTFTISNGGVYGSLLSTPIVNPPQSGILGLHAIQDRAVVRDGAVVVRPMMYVALSYDHRIVDGREAVTFLKRVKDLIEDPARLLLGV